MNKENIRRVAEAIRNNPNNFNMESYLNYRDNYNRSNVYSIDLEKSYCKTTCCICGWANYFRLKDKYQLQKLHGEASCVNEAIKWLDLSVSKTYQLFVPRKDCTDMEGSYWLQAYRKNIISSKNPYEVPPLEVADMLDAIADGVIV